MAQLDSDLYTFGHTPIGKRELALAPLASWWATAPREGFFEAFEKQDRRESRRVDTSRLLEAPVRRIGRPRVERKGPRCSKANCRRWLTEEETAMHGLRRCGKCRKDSTTRTREAA